MIKKKVPLLCRILGHNYDIFERDGVVYRNCRRCSGCHEVLNQKCRICGSILYDDELPGDVCVDCVMEKKQEANND